MKSYPLISIIIPTYKRPKTLGRAIDSVLFQSYDNLEVIVVDDNDESDIYRNETEKFMEEYLNHERVKYIKHKKNRNGAAARNTGIKKSSGDYIGFLDDDDEFLKNKIEKQLEYLQKNKNFKISYCKAIHCKNNEPYYKTKFSKKGKLQYEILTMTQEIYTPSLLINANILTNVKGFNESFIRHQDYDLLLRISENYEIGCVDEYLLKIHNDDTLNQPTFKQYEKNKMAFLDEFSSYINKYGTKKKNDIYKLHYFDLFYYALKCGRFRKSLSYLLRSKPNLFVLSAKAKNVEKIIRRGFS